MYFIFCVLTRSDLQTHEYKNLVISEHPLEWLMKEKASRVGNPHEKMVLLNWRTLSLEEEALWKELTQRYAPILTATAQKSIVGG